jgi:hypothetical protein
MGIIGDVNLDYKVAWWWKVPIKATGGCSAMGAREMWELHANFWSNDFSGIDSFG